MEIKILTFDIKGDERGLLIALETNKNIPFEIKRIYYIFNTKEGVRRGYHAHKSLEQVLVCTSGKCKILLDDGHHQDIVELNRADKGLYIGPLTWHEMFDFSPDCVLMVLASDFYDENDYIRNYEDFKEMLE